MENFSTGGYLNYFSLFALCYFAYIISKVGIAHHYGSYFGELIIF
jgi:hypothetical protein